jgi:hypothetical protein
MNLCANVQSSEIESSYAQLADIALTIIFCIFIHFIVSSSKYGELVGLL